MSTDNKVHDTNPSIDENGDNETPKKEIINQMVSRYTQIIQSLSELVFADIYCNPRSPSDDIMTLLESHYLNIIDNLIAMRTTLKESVVVQLESPIMSVARSEGGDDVKLNDEAHRLVERLANDIEEGFVDSDNVN